MGLIGKILGGGAGAVAVGDAVTGVAEVFLPNATKKMEAAQEAYMAALEEHGDEFRFVRPGRFDRFVNGLNRMPRPMLALALISGVRSGCMASSTGVGTVTIKMRQAARSAASLL